MEKKLVEKIEDLFYSFGHVSYLIGRMETDEATNSKKYDNACKEKEEIKKTFEEIIRQK